MNITGVIVDDEYLAIKIIEEYSLKLDGLKIERSFTRPSDALEFLSSNPVELIFLDIQMPELSGFDLLKKLHNPPLIIFTTARHDYAVQAFELDVLDYLVKPIPFERFEKAVRKTAEYLEFKKMRTTSTDAMKDSLMIKADYRIHKIMFESIEYIECLSEYVKIHTAERTYVPFASLKELIDQLPSKKFIRIHKSYIISLAHIVSFNHQSVTLKNGKDLPVGRSYKSSFLSQVSTKG
jgi:DNA-binding LytR/AlgR family response regulator